MYDGKGERVKIVKINECVYKIENNGDQRLKTFNGKKHWN